MIEVVDRFEAQDQWGIAVLLEDDCGEQRCFEAMRGPQSYDAPEAAQRRTPVRPLVTAPSFSACVFRTRGVSVAGSKLTVNRCALKALCSAFNLFWMVTKLRSINGQNVGIGQLV